MYPPLVLRDFSSSFRVEFGIFSLHVAGVSSIAGAINYVTRSVFGRRGGVFLQNMSLYV